MVYDTFTSLLLSTLSTEEGGSTNVLIARYLLEHVSDQHDISVKELAEACHVGTGTVSRFARDAGFGSFADLRRAFEEFRRSFARERGASAEECAQFLAQDMSDCMAQVERTLDFDALRRLAADISHYEKVLAVGLLKGQSAALGLQVDLLMLGKVVDTCNAYAEQLERIRTAGKDTLAVVFSYTGSYFDVRSMDEALRRIDRPKIWMVCGARRPLPEYVAERVLFEAGMSPFGHPLQMQFVASLIAQEYARQM